MWYFGYWAREYVLISTLQMTKHIHTFGSIFPTTESILKKYLQMHINVYKQ